MTATRTAPKWLGDYIDELSDLGFFPVSAGFEDFPEWVANTGAYAAMLTIPGNVVTVTDNPGDERVTVTVLTTNGVLLHDPLTFGAHDLGFSLLFAVLTALADA